MLVTCLPNDDLANHSVQKMWTFVDMIRNPTEYGVPTRGEHDRCPRDTTVGRMHARRANHENDVFGHVDCSVSRPRDDISCCLSVAESHKFEIVYLRPRILECNYMRTSAQCVAHVQFVVLGPNEHIGRRRRRRPTRRDCGEFIRLDKN